MSEAKRPKKQFRRRKESSDSDSGEDGTAADSTSASLQDTKLQQEMRKRPKGVSHIGLAMGKVLRKPTGVPIVDSFSLKAGGLVDAKKLNRLVTGDDIGGETIGTEFAAETNQRDEDAEMLKFVEAEVDKRNGLVDEEKVKLNRSQSAEQKLYEVPEALRGESAIKKSEEMISNTYLSGIPEVDLGISAKIKNIEATEEAKQRLLKEKMEQKGRPSEYVPSNMAVDFVQHNRFKISDNKTPSTKSLMRPRR